MLRSKLPATIAILSLCSQIHAAELLPGEPCDSCDLGPYIEQQCADDMSQVLLMSSWFEITNTRGEVLPVYGNVCVQPEDEGGNEFEGIWHDVSYDFGYSSFAIGGGGAGGAAFGNFIPFAVVATQEDHRRRHGAPTVSSNDTPAPAPPVDVPNVPIPGTFWLFSAALFGLGALTIGRRRWRYSKK